MVVREPDGHDDFFVKVEGRWLRIDREFLSWHPGGNALVAYKNKDATTAFHTFHVGSKWAYKMLMDRQRKEPDLKVGFWDGSWSLGSGCSVDFRVVLTVGMRILGKFSLKIKVLGKVSPGNQNFQLF